jgi:hypothetical protein
MKQLFPPEIIHDSAEKYFNQQHTASRAVYLILLSALITLIILLPVIKVDITTQGGGVIRSRFDDNIIQSAVQERLIRRSVIISFRLKKKQFT